MKYKFIIIIGSLLFISSLGYSQRWKLAREELIYGIGTVNYFGDIGGAEKADASPIADFDLAYTRPNLSVGYRYRILYI